MNAADRLASRLSRLTKDDGVAADVAEFIYDEYLPSQIIGMKEAAQRLGLATSNTLCMRLDRGHDLLIVAKIATNRLTTVDACDAYLESHEKRSAISDDVRREAS